MNKTKNKCNTHFFCFVLKNQTASKHFFVTENRPARKNYNKLSGEDISRTKTEHLDNVDACKQEGCTTHDTNNDTDTDSSFTDIELDDRDDFSDDSDYGK